MPYSPWSATPQRACPPPQMYGYLFAVIAFAAAYALATSAGTFAPTCDTRLRPRNRPSRSSRPRRARFHRRFRQRPRGPLELQRRLGVERSLGTSLTSQRPFPGPQFSSTITEPGCSPERDARTVIVASLVCLPLSTSKSITSIPSVSSLPVTAASPRRASSRRRTQTGRRRRSSASRTSPASRAGTSRSTRSCRRAAALELVRDVGGRRRSVVPSPSRRRRRRPTSRPRPGTGVAGRVRPSPGACATWPAVQLGFLAASVIAPPRPVKPRVRKTLQHASISSGSMCSGAGGGVPHLEDSRERSRSPLSLGRFVIVDSTITASTSASAARPGAERVGDVEHALAVPAAGCSPARP